MALQKVTIFAGDLRYYTYALLCQHDDGPLYVKFGRTGNFPHRIIGVLVGCPIPLKGVAVLAHGASDVRAKAAERALRKEFKDLRTQGEWFAFDPKKDKKRFNEGCARALRKSLGSRHPWWMEAQISRSTS